MTGGADAYIKPGFNCTGGYYLAAGKPALFVDPVSHSTISYEQGDIQFGTNLIPNEIEGGVMLPIIMVTDWTKTYNVPFWPLGR